VYDDGGGIAMQTKRKKKQGKPDPEILADVVVRVVRAAAPEKIVLFGSAARGEMGPHSDIDILVIKRGKFDYGRMLTTIYSELSEIDSSVDVVLATPETVERYRDSYCLVYHPAMREGRIIYEAEALPSGRSARMAQSGAKQSGASAGRRPRRVS
jgi:predicted nucleotidyltransferase